MRKLMLCLLLSGCGALSDGETSADLIRGAPPATPLIAWQFNYCLDDDHRNGLIAAIKHHETIRVDLQWLSSNTVGDSRCIASEERGALFATSDRGDHGKALAYLNIRPPAKPFAFAATTAAINDIASVEWPWVLQWGTQRFDDNGRITPTGRYELVTYDLPIAERPQSKTVVLDHQTNHSIELYQSRTVANNNGYLLCASGSWTTDPPISSNPLVQTVINATTNALPNIIPRLTNLEAGCGGLIAISVSLEPSLKGWPLGFDDWYADAYGNEIGVGGGTLIQ